MEVNFNENQLIEQTRPLTQEVKLKRVKCNFIAENSRFLLDCDFSKQYSHYYNKRLNKSKPFLEFNCRLKWPNSIQILTLAELATIIEKKQSQESVLETTNAIKTEENAKNDEFIIIGTIFKRMKLQPDVIQELSEGFHLNCDRYLGHYVSQDDKLVLEDADETIALVGNIEPSRFVTGIVVALLGYPLEDGSQFYVKDVCYAEPNWLLIDDEDDDDDVSDESLIRIDERLSSTPMKPMKKMAKFDDDNNFHEKKFSPLERTKYLMVVSGFGFHQDMAKESSLTRALQDLINFIWGAGKYVDDERSSQVARILVVGDCLLEDRLDPDEDSSSQEIDIRLKMKSSRQVKPYASSIQAVKHMDDFFAQLSKTINVDIMPGQSDPSSHLMPQQPFHPCMFPKSCMFPTFNCITNPSHAIYNDNVVVFATSGQNIDIIKKFSNLNDPIEIMKSHLIWGNCAPSAPDNLYSVPYEDDDPHVIDFIPTIYIAGCQDYYRTEYYQYSYNSLHQRAEEDNNKMKDDDDDNNVKEDIKPRIKTEKTSQQQVPVATRSLDGTSGCDIKIKDEFIKKDRTLLITVPKFYETFSCILINLITLESHLMSFK